MGLRTELKAQSATIHPSVPPVQLLPVHRRRLVGKSTRILSNRLRRRLRKARKASKRSSDIARDSKAGLLRLSRLSRLLFLVDLSNKGQLQGVELLLRRLEGVTPLVHHSLGDMESLQTLGLNLQV